MDPAQRLSPTRSRMPLVLPLSSPPSSPLYSDNSSPPSSPPSSDPAYSPFYQPRFLSTSRLHRTASPSSSTPHVSGTPSRIIQGTKRASGWMQGGNGPRHRKQLPSRGRGSRIKANDTYSDDGVVYDHMSRKGRGTMQIKYNGYLYIHAEKNTLSTGEIRRYRH